ncbi:hypothetical protein Hanom_Chr03g00230841 [Helianthus anomalus]
MKPVTNNPPPELKLARVLTTTTAAVTSANSCNWSPFLRRFLGQPRHHQTQLKQTTLPPISS